MNSRQRRHEVRLRGLAVSGVGRCAAVLGGIVLLSACSTPDAPGASAPMPGNPAPALTFCGADPPPSWAPDKDLHCMDLTPTVDFAGASGTVEMGRAPSPFGVAVDRNGTHIWDLALTAKGLPDPADTEDVGAYIAWATTPNLSPMINLGEVGPGIPASGRVALDKFLVLVTAEPSADVEERTGPVVLRGNSPSMRMVPHEVPYLFVAPDVGHDGHGHGDDLEWSMPPMHPRVPMPPGMGHLRPSVRPFLPTAGERAADHRPTEVWRLEDGDTVRLVAQPVRRTIAGHAVTLYGFNGQTPGPLIRVERGATITVQVQNDTELPTAVHWHGIRLGNRFDGVPGVTQEAIPPRGDFTYEVHLPDAGLYWYHPHHREDITQALGLYGNLRVDAQDAEYLNPVHREEVWVMDDLLLGENGLIPYGDEAPTHALMGRFGNTLLVNGDPERHLEVDRGEVVRFLLTNVASTRTFNLSFGGAARTKLIASDLSRFAREAWVRSVVIAPAERYVVEVRFDEPGAYAVENRVRGIDHLYGNYFADVDTLAVVWVRDDPAPDLGTDFERLREHPDVVSEVDRLRSHFTRPAERELVLTQEVGELPFPLRQLMQIDSAFFNPVEWSGTMPDMDWVPTGNEVEWTLLDPATGRENMEIDWRFRQGDLVRLRIRNEREVLHAMQHPIHIHGQRFLVISMNGVPNENLVWKDTFLLPVGWTAELLVEMSNPGDWMVHCHISEHLESGMMAVFRVDPVEGEWEGWRGFEPGQGHEH